MSRRFDRIVKRLACAAMCWVLATAGLVNSVVFGQSAGVAKPQQDTLTLQFGDTLLLDALGQLYRWSERSEVEKLRTANQLAGTDTLRFRFRNVRLGKLSSVDISNPLRPVLFFHEAQTVVWLNRNLTEQRQLDLLDFGITSADAVAYAPNDGLWVYDPDQQQLVMYDRNGRVEHKSPELSQLFGTSIRVRELVATPQQVAMATTDGRLLLFGPFAGYRTQVLRPATGLLANERALVFREGAEWFSYNGPTSLVQRLEAGEGEEQALVSVRGERALWRWANRWWLNMLP